MSSASRHYGPARNIRSRQIEHFCIIVTLSLVKLNESYALRSSARSDCLISNRGAKMIGRLLKHRCGWHAPRAVGHYWCHFMPFTSPIYLLLAIAWCKNMKRAISAITGWYSYYLSAIISGHRRQCQQCFSKYSYTIFPLSIAMNRHLSRHGLFRCR